MQIIYRDEWNDYRVTKADKITALLNGNAYLEYVGNYYEYIGNDDNKSLFQNVTSVDKHIAVNLTEIIDYSDYYAIRFRR